MNNHEMANQAAIEAVAAIEQLRPNAYGQIVLTFTKRNGRFESVESQVTTRKQLTKREKPVKMSGT